VPKDATRKKNSKSAEKNSPKSGPKASSKPASKTERKAQKKLREELDRKRRTRNNALTAAIIVAIVVAGLLVVLRINRPRGEMTLPNDGATEFCDAIQTFQIDDRQHEAEGQPVAYPQDPPVGGKHWGSPPPPDDGFYTTEIPKELTTHSLEHGQIVIWYNQGDEEVARWLKDAVSEKKSFLVAVPRSEPLPGGSRMVITSWGRSQTCRDFDLTALRQFQDAFKNKGPERVRMG
jgi:hypothetical protein